ncbi:MAG: hypothetical protein LKM35_03305 [Lachnospiraceae bacterium]|jgi:hypothetical protein|nr:hypothetical protein [Lachnospiraceae bacterium]
MIDDIADALDKFRDQLGNKGIDDEDAQGCRKQRADDADGRPAGFLRMPLRPADDLNEDILDQLEKRI